MIWKKLSIIKRAEYNKLMRATDIKEAYKFILNGKTKLTDEQFAVIRHNIATLYLLAK